MTTHDSAAALRLGFARGIAPNKWAKRWVLARPEHPLELVPLPVLFGSGVTAGHGGTDHDGSEPPIDVMLERARPGQRPEADHAILLYTEAVALVVAADHELAESDAFDTADLGLVHLLDHSDHSPDWPDPAPWADPSYAPENARAALDLVTAGLGAMLLPLPLARHLTRKREHAVLALRGAHLAGSTVWASWAAERDDADVQQLVGILRGRTARSSRTTNESRPQKQQTTQQPKQAKPKQPKLKPNSRGAQLAAAKAKAERRKAEARRAKKRRR